MIYFGTAIKNAFAIFSTWARRTVPKPLCVIPETLAENPVVFGDHVYACRCGNMCRYAPDKKPAFSAITSDNEKKKLLRVIGHELNWLGVNIGRVNDIQSGERYFVKRLWKDTYDYNIEKFGL